MLGLSELREIARVAYFGQITIIGSGRERKLLKVRSHGGRDINVHDCAGEKDCSLRIARNRMGSIFRPNNEYLMRSHAKIIKRALLGGPGYKLAQYATRKRLPSQNRAKWQR